MSQPGRPGTSPGRRPPTADRERDMDMQTEPMECDDCGQPVAVVDGVTVDVDSVDVEHDCDS